MKVFISGASSGIGFELARQYLQEGAIVGGLARRIERLRILEENWPGNAIIYSADVRDTRAMQAAAHDFISRYGCPDIVFANAGVSIGNLTQYADDIDTVQVVFDTNVLGLVRTFQPFLPEMKTANQGRLVGIASIAGFRGLPGASAYSASKAAVISYMESMRTELHGTGISVSTICPGYIDTPMTAHNPYPMPFRLSADKAAENIRHAVARGRQFHVFPWQMRIAGILLKMMPDWLYVALFSKAPHKPRQAN